MFHLFIFTYYVDHRDLHSFPTRRSSDLSPRVPMVAGSRLGRRPGPQTIAAPRVRSAMSSRLARRRLRSGPPAQRSEEHTSELQSRLHLVCRLLLVKKKLAIFNCNFINFS